MDFKVYKFAESPTSACWSQTYEFNPENADLLAKRGRLYAVVSLSLRQEAENLTLSGKEVITRLHEEYYGREGGSPYAALTSALKRLEKEFLENGQEITIAAAAFVASALFVSCTKNAKIVLVRGKASTILLEGKDEIISASGYPKEGDWVIAGTSDFFGRVSEQFLVEKMSLGKEVFLSEVSTKIAEPREGRSTAFLLGFGEEKALYGRTFFVNLSDLSASKRKIASIALVLIVLLLASVFLGNFVKERNRSEQAYKEKLLLAETKLKDAEDLVNIDRVKARELFWQADSIARESLVGVSDKRARDFIKRIEEARGLISQEYEVSPSTFLDLSLLSDGFLGNSIILSGETAYIFDASAKKLASVGIKTKKARIEVGPDRLTDTTEVGVYEDRIFAKRGENVYESLEVEEKRVLEEELGEGASFILYAGNIYVLDKDAGKILRFQGQGGSFGAKQEWFGPGVAPDLSQTSAWIIDGSVWILGKTGRVSKYSQGAPDAVSSEISSQRVSDGAIFASDETAGVYVLDPKGKKIFVYDKKGKFIVSYFLRDINEVSGIVVLESEKKMILLSQSKLYSVELKHI